MNILLKLSYRKMLLCYGCLTSINYVFFLHIFSFIISHQHYVIFSMQCLVWQIVFEYVKDELTACTPCTPMFCQHGNTNTSFVILPDDLSLNWHIKKAFWVSVRSYSLSLNYKMLCCKLETVVYLLHVRAEINFSFTSFSD